MRRVTANQGNLFGGVDAVRVKRSGSVCVIVHREGPKQLTLDGGVEQAHTKRNEANLQREAEDQRQGRTAK